MLNTVQLIVGNGLALVSTLLVVASGAVKSRKTSVLLQFLHEAACSCGDLVLGGYSGAIVDGVDAVRDVLSYRNRLTQRLKYVLIFVASALIFYFNNLGLIGLLPLVATVFYTLNINTQDPVRYKLCLMFTWVLGIIYNLVILSLVGAAVQGAALVSGAVSLVRLKREKNTSKNQNISKSGNETKTSAKEAKA